MEEHVIKMLAEILNRKESELNVNMSLLEDLNIESVELLEIAFEIEDRFEKHFTDHTLWKLPNYLLANKLFDNSKFSLEGIELIKKEIPSLNETEIKNCKSPHDLLKMIQIKDIVSFLQK